MANDRPDIIVAVDLGTTYTGVAWARPQRNQVIQSPIQIIHNWPGSSSRNEQKVQTCLVYHGDKLSSWGYQCEEENEVETERQLFFKIFLDKQTLEAAHHQGLDRVPSSLFEAQKLVSDYLRQIYWHVKSTVEIHTGINHLGWENLVVEFVFSVPTTWKSQDTINIFKTCIEEAGFGKEGQHHTATVELTEPEAAAVGTIKSSTVTFQPGDIFLSIDAGGGTTDFALMQVVEARDPFPSLSQINQVDGIGIGSTMIDTAFVSMLNSRLGGFPDLVQKLPPDCIERLVKSERYKMAKHKFGERVYQSNSYKLTLDGVPFNLNHPAAGIERGEVVISWDEMQSLFEPHIEGIMRKIHEQLAWMQTNGIDRPISRMILSGGLGSSRYVRDRLNHELSTNPHPCAPKVKILQAPDPQLVVVKGLLLDRLQRIDSRLAPVIVRRVARASYGLVCKTKYNPEVHVDEMVKKDPLDGELYAMGQIDWLIKKGDPVNTNEPIITTFTKKVDPGGPTQMWESIIMISDLDRDLLPRRLEQGGAKQLCVVKSDLTGAQHSEMVPRRRPGRLLFRGKRFYLCTFEVRAVVAPADIRFELWFAGQRFSGNHEPIRVTWDAEGSKVGS